MDDVETRGVVLALILGDSILGVVALEMEERVPVMLEISSLLCFQSVDVGIVFRWLLSSVDEEEDEEGEEGGCARSANEKEDVDFFEKDGSLGCGWGAFEERSVLVSSFLYCVSFSNMLRKRR